VQSALLGGAGRDDNIKKQTVKPWLANFRQFDRRLLLPRKCNMEASDQPVALGAYWYFWRLFCFIKG